jgi:hypothetical protein
MKNLEQNEKFFHAEARRARRKSELKVLILFILYIPVVYAFEGFIAVSSATSASLREKLLTGHRV